MASRRCFGRLTAFAATFKKGPLLELHDVCGVALANSSDSLFPERIIKWSGGISVISPSAARRTTAFNPRLMTDHAHPSQSNLAPGRSLFVDAMIGSTCAFVRFPNQTATLWDPADYPTTDRHICRRSQSAHNSDPVLTVLPSAETEYQASIRVARQHGPALVAGEAMARTAFPVCNFRETEFSAGTTS
jgi:hypothetical protein